MPAGDTEREPWLAARRHEFRHGLAMPRDDDRFALLNEFEKARELGLGCVDIHLHTINLVHFIS